MNLYKQILGDEWSRVDVKVRNSHLDGSEFRARCLLDVRGSNHLLGKIISRIVSLPAPRSGANVDLLVRTGPTGEIWERAFPGKSLNSIQSKSDSGLLIDRFGIIAFHFQLEVSERSIRHLHKKTYLHIRPFRIRLPVWASPKVVSYESPDHSENASRIEVSLSMPLTGHLLTYTGIVRPVKSPQ